MSTNAVWIVGRVCTHGGGMGTRVRYENGDEERYCGYCGVLVGVEAALTCTAIVPADGGAIPTQGAFTARRCGKPVQWVEERRCAECGHPEESTRLTNLGPDGREYCVALGFTAPPHPNEEPSDGGVVCPCEYFVDVEPIPRTLHHVAPALDDQHRATL